MSSFSPLRLCFHHIPIFFRHNQTNICRTQTNQTQISCIDSPPICVTYKYGIIAAATAKKKKRKRSTRIMVINDVPPEKWLDCCSKKEDHRHVVTVDGVATAGGSSGSTNNRTKPVFVSDYPTVIDRRGKQNEGYVYGVAGDHVTGFYHIYSRQGTSIALQHLKRKADQARHRKDKFLVDHSYGLCCMGAGMSSTDVETYEALQKTFYQYQDVYLGLKSQYESCGPCTVATEALLSRFPLPLFKREQTGTYDEDDNNDDEVNKVNNIDWKRFYQTVVQEGSGIGPREPIVKGLLDMRAVRERKEVPFAKNQTIAHWNTANSHLNRQNNNNNKTTLVMMALADT
jgi:hypothetical protein